jgi:DNA-binding transcriptional regulator YdaS (Cro superfamily)
MQDIEKSPIDKAIALMGGVAETVRTLGLNGHATVYQWTKTRVPAERCPAIEAATNGLVRCEDLRPDVAWGVLRGNTATTPASIAQAATETVAV